VAPVFSHAIERNNRHLVGGVAQPTRIPQNSVLKELQRNMGADTARRLVDTPGPRALFLEQASCAVNVPQS
jgi:hypothetical protein